MIEQLPAIFKDFNLAYAEPKETSDEPIFFIKIRGESVPNRKFASIQKEYKLYEQHADIHNILSAIHTIKAHGLLGHTIRLDNPPKWWNTLEEYRLIPRIKRKCNTIQRITMTLKFDSIHIDVDIDCPTPVKETKRATDKEIKSASIKEYLLSTTASVPEIEEFLNLPVSNDVIETLADRIDNALTDMPEKTITKFYNKFDRRKRKEQNQTCRPK